MIQLNFGKLLLVMPLDDFSFCYCYEKTIPVQGTNGTNELMLYSASTDKNQEFISMMDELLPPLDVIMVWHSFYQQTLKMLMILW